MSESIKQEVAISQSALAELVKQTQARGGNLTVLFQSAVGIGAHGLGAIFGGQRAGELVRNVADSQSLLAREGLKGVNHNDPDEQGHRRYVAAALDGAPPGFDRDMLYACALIHSALSIVARIGANQAVATLTDLVATISNGVDDRTMRSGNPRMDAN